MTLKILFLGFDKNDIPSVDSSFDVEVSTRGLYDLNDSPALYDYHIIVMDIAPINKELDRIGKKAESSHLSASPDPTDEELLFDSALAESKGLFKQLVETGGQVFCFGDAEKKWEGRYYSQSEGHDHVGNTSHSWCPVPLKVVNGTGPNVYPKPNLGEYGILADNFKEIDRSWTAHFSGYPVNSKVLFTNRAEYAVGLEIPLGKGRIVFLPRFSSISFASKLLIEKVGLPRLGAKPKKMTPSVRQPWVAKFEFVSKKRALEALQKAKLDIEGYQKFEPLLDSDGEELRQALKHAFSEIGFQATQPPETKPVQDLNLTSGQWNAVVEIKGKTGDANIQDLRQLLQYLVDIRDIEQKPAMNGVFVINHYCNVDPEKRGKPFTDAAFELAKKYRIILLTSYDIYTAIGKVLEGKDTFEAVRTRIMQGQL